VQEAATLAELEDALEVLFYLGGDALTGTQVLL
jgi:hypothetical protein